MVLKINSLSFSQVQQSLIDYFNSQAQSQKWKDFYESSAGKMFIRLLSAFGSFISYQATISRREAYITYAQNRSSLIGIAQNLGYSVFRGSNETIKIRVTPSLTGFIPKFTSIGGIKNLEIVSKEGVSLNKNQETEIEVYIGNLKTENIIIDTEALKQFRFVSTGVSDAIRFLLNGVIIPHSEHLKDLSKDKYVAISNPLGGVDVQYIQEGNYKYKATDTLTLQYIELAKAEYTVTDIHFDFGVVEDITGVTPFREAESNDSIRIKAPLYHETQITVRARNDYLKEFTNLGYNLADTNSRDFTPAIVDLTYVRDGYTLLGNEEEAEVLDTLYSMRAMGVPMPRIIYPKHYKLNLNFNIKKNTGDDTSIVDVEANVRELVSAYEKALKPSVDLEILERDMEDFDYVKRTRVSLITSQRQNNTLYSLGNFVTLNPDNGKVYMAYDFIRQSGSSEPVWTYNVGDSVQDNGIVWRCIPRYGKVVPEWKADRHYRIGSLVFSTATIEASLLVMFEAVSIIKSSGATLPGFNPTVGEFTEDNELIWVCKEKITTDPVWQSNHDYELGDSIKEGDFSYEVIGFRALSDSPVPVFKTTDNYDIISVSQVDKTFMVAGNKIEHFLPNDTVRVNLSTGNNGYYTVVSSAFNGINTVIEIDTVIPSSVADGIIYMEDAYTKDGGLLWKMYNADEFLFNYEWNNYIKITTNVYLN